MKMLALALGLMVSCAALADTGDVTDRNEVLAVSRGQYYDARVETQVGGVTASPRSFCTDRPEQCAYQARHASSAPAVVVTLVPTAAGCSNAGDETSRPVYATVRGQITFLGYECIQDNRGNGGGN